MGELSASASITPQPKLRSILAARADAKAIPPGGVMRPSRAEPSCTNDDRRVVVDCADGTRRPALCRGFGSVGDGQVLLWAHDAAADTLRSPTPCRRRWRIASVDRSAPFCAEARTCASRSRATTNHAARPVARSSRRGVCMALEVASRPTLAVLGPARVGRSPSEARFPSQRPGVFGFEP